MKKFKLFLVGLSLLACSSFAFAMEKTPQGIKMENEVKKETKSEKEIEKLADEIVNKIDFNYSIKDGLEECGYLKNNSFTQYNDYELKGLTYNDFVKETKRQLKEKIKDLLKNNKINENKDADYSEFKIYMPDYCVYSSVNFDGVLEKFVDGPGKLILTKEGKFDFVDSVYDKLKTEDLKDLLEVENSILNLNQKNKQKSDSESEEIKKSDSESENFQTPTPDGKNN